MVAVGNLDKIWLSIPADVPMMELQDAFRGYFGVGWDKVLDTADPSFYYNAFNRAYFAVRDLLPVEDLTLDQLSGKDGIDKPPHIIVS